MNTQKILLVLMGFLFCVSKVSSQTYYYDKTKTFSENGYTYQCDKPEWGLVTLYNKVNQYTYSRYVYKNGTPVSDSKIVRGEDLIGQDNWTRQKSFSIVNSSFTAVEKQRVKGDPFDVSMTIDTSTGKVIEVDFCFYYSDAMGTIPVSTYRKIELALKEQIWFTLTDVGKQLKFVKVGWMHTVE